MENLEQVLSAIAETLGFTFFGPREPKTQLLDYLKNKEMLLVLDNFDHLLQEAGLPQEMLEQAPKLHLLVTSRRHLDLPEAWNYPLQGLPPPDPNALESSDAVLLFLQAARRNRPDFKPTPTELQAIAELSLAVEGLPLALELAAAWVRELSCREILEEIRDHQGLLGPRASGMEAVFAYSWHLLSPEQQRLMLGLSLFRGGFDREAAQKTQGVSHYLLLSLVGRSLLQKEPTGRYRMHLLLQQYTQEKLAQQPQLQTQLQHQHALYFAAFLDVESQQLRQGFWDQVVSKVAIEAENIRTAWAWLLEGLHWPQLELGLGAWGQFLSSRGLYHEGQATFAELAETAHGEGRMLLWARATQQQGWFNLQLGQIENAKALFEQSLPLLEQHRHTDGLLFSYNGLGVAWTQLGDYTQAENCFQKARALAEQTHNTASLANIFNSLGNTCRWTGKLAQAIEFFQQGLCLAEEIGNWQTTAFLLANLGGALWEMGEQHSGWHATQQAAQLAEEIQHWPLLSGCLSNLAEMSFVQKDYAQSNELRQRSLNLRRELGNRRGEAVDTVMLGYNALRLGQPQEARRRFLEGLRIALGVAARPVQLDALIGLAELELQQGNILQALHMLLLAAQDPATSAEAKGRANQLLASLPQNQIEAFQQKNVIPQLEQMLAQIFEQS